MTSDVVTYVSTDSYLNSHLDKEFFYCDPDKLELWGWTSDKKEPPVSERVPRPIGPILAMHPYGSSVIVVVDGVPHRARIFEGDYATFQANGFPAQIPLIGVPNVCSFHFRIRVKTEPELSW